MGKWAIVAIPKEGDPVWDVSSEKIPHLTLLFLGEDGQGVSLPDVNGYLEHAVKTSIGRFGLSVDHRGKLGPDNADVLFFTDYNMDKLKENRALLLKNDLIAQAYNNTPQFPNWTPHLTLGFPDSPAKPDEREWRGFSWIEFDRIALWTGDFSGFEYQLEDKSRGTELAMSEQKTEAFMEHAGIKGMKWGVRKRDSSSGTPASADGSKVEAIRTTAKTAGTNSLSNKQLQTAIDRMRLEKQYSELSSQTAVKGAGRRFVESLLGEIGSTEARRVGKGAASLGVEAALRKAGHDDLATRIKPKKK